MQDSTDVKPDTKSRSAVVATMIVVATKAAKLVKVLKIFKATKLLVMFVSMAISAFAYALAYGPEFGVGIVLLLFAHEMGHVAALDRRGYKMAAPIFIPMLGAVIFAPKFKSSEDEAFVGLGGPLFGTLASLALFACYLSLPHKYEILVLLSFVSTYLNLFNLLPVRPLDGGRALQIIGVWGQRLGIAALLLYSFWLRQPVVLYIWIIALSDMSVRPWVRFGLSASCWVAMAALMLAGLSDQPKLVDAIDCVFGAVLVGLAYYGTRVKSFEEAPASCATLPWRTRALWVTCYAGLVVALVALLLAQVGYLPPQLLKR